MTDGDSQLVHCKAEENMAALYQWVIQVGEHTIMTDNYVCRTGDGAWEK